MAGYPCHRAVDAICGSPTVQDIFADQDLLNIVLEHEKYELPLRCNAQEGFFGDMPDIPATACRQLRQAASDPLIVHFLGYEETDRGMTAAPIHCVICGEAIMRSHHGV